MSDYPLVPLVVLLVAAGRSSCSSCGPGIVNERWIANTVKFAIPLAMLAGCQTHDHADRRHRPLGRARSRRWPPSSWRPRSVQHDPAIAILLALRPGGADRPRQRHRRRRLPRAPADHDARHQPDRHRLPAGLPAHRHRHRHRDPRLPRLARHRPHLGRPERAPPLRAGRGADHLHAAPHRLRPPALRRRRQRARDAHLRACSTGR